MVIPSETYLLNRLFDYYHYSIFINQNLIIPCFSDCREKNKKFESLLLTINIEFVKWEELSSTAFHYIWNFDELLWGRKEYNYKRIYCELPFSGNDKFTPLIIKYYTMKQLPLSIEQDDIESIKNIDVLSHVRLLLYSSDIKINEIALLIMIDSKIEYECIYISFIL